MKNVKSVKLFYTTEVNNGNHIWFEGDLFGHFSEHKFYIELDHNVYDKSESFWVALVDYAEFNMADTNGE